MLTSKQSMLRNIFPEEEEEYWQEAVAAFPNRCPRFETKPEAVAFTKRYCTIGSNPDNPQLQHSVTTLTSWEQVAKYLLPKIDEYNVRFNRRRPNASMLSGNRFAQAPPEDEGDGNSGDPLGPRPSGRGVYLYLLSRIHLSIHRTLSSYSTLNTLRYLFNHMKCGIFVMIRSNRLVIFSPFVNTDYRNDWRGRLRVGSVDGSVEKYFSQKSLQYREENFIEDTDRWWANGNIICNEYEKDVEKDKESRSQLWGDHFLFQLKDMVSETCNRREVPDCDFFINKRDYPHLKFHKDQGSGEGGGGDDAEQPGRPVEPYGFIFDCDDRDPEQDVELGREVYASYAPVLSFYTSDRFADIPFPPSEDWEAATGLVFPGTFQHDIRPPEAGSAQGAEDFVIPGNTRDLFTAQNLRKFNTPWEDKVDTAFFRGTATGGGVTIDTNQRLHLSHLSHQWQQQQQGEGEEHAPPRLDAKIVGWNLRDKKISSSPMTCITKADFKDSLGEILQDNFVEIYKQSTYKYLVYVEGHCAACRYGFMMQLGSVILKVESRCVAAQMWYFPILRPYYDHVPVKADLSDLQEKIDWCRANDSSCRAIARNALDTYNSFVSRDGVLDYMQCIFVEISKRWVYPAAWATFNGMAEEAPPRPQALRAAGCCTRSGELCSTCQKHAEEEERAQRELATAAQTATQTAAASRGERAAKKRKVRKDGEGKMRNAMLLAESLMRG